MSEPTDTNAGEDARSGFDLQEGEAGAAGDIPKVPDIGENVGEKAEEQPPSSEPKKKAGGKSSDPAPTSGS